MSGLSSASRSSAMIDEVYSWISARWVIMAPLGFDVVPDV